MGSCLVTRWAAAESMMSELDRCLHQQRLRIICLHHTLIRCEKELGYLRHVRILGRTGAAARKGRALHAHAQAAKFHNSSVKNVISIMDIFYVTVLFAVVQTSPHDIRGQGRETLMPS